ncbi:MAG: hypothetical protein PHE16_10630 [Aliarcobacter sp.]|nr:hypothetical protein [Aliarcobacter sp.]
MAANTSHPSFVNNQPENDNVKLWRYMDFIKFVSMLLNKSIYLSNANTFEDNFEETILNANKSDFIDNIDNFNEKICLINLNKLHI